MEQEKKKRGCKTTQQQYEIFINFLKNNPKFRVAKMDPSDHLYLKKTWEELKNLLNSCGQGPQHDVVGWKKALKNWKSSVRSKARALQVHMKGTGGGPSAKPLTDLEETLLAVIGSVNVYGAEDVDLIGGFANNIPLIEIEETVSETREDVQTAEVTRVEEVEPEPPRTTPASKTPHRIRNRAKKSNIASANTAQDMVASFVAASNKQTEMMQSLLEVLQDISKGIKELTAAKLEKAKIEMLRLQFDYPDVLFND